MPAAPGGRSRLNYVFALGGELMVDLIEIAKPMTRLKSIRQTERLVEIQTRNGISTLLAAPFARSPKHEPDSDPAT